MALPMRWPPWGTDPAVDRDVDLRRWRDELDDAVPIADLRPRHPATCVGVIERIRLLPGQGLEVTVTDGSGRLVGAWTGRTRLPGIELGGALRLSGTVALGTDEVPRMLNPAWDPVTEPYG